MPEEKTRIIPMTYDKMFKSVLTSKEARDYLSEIISDITGLPKKNIKKDMVFKNSGHSINSINEKKKISDLVVEVEDNVINLEMNKDYYDGLVDRNHEYIIKIRESMLGEGKEYKELKKVIQINFDNYNIYKPDDRVVIKFEMRDKEKGIKEGIERGVKQGVINTARNMLNKNIDIKTISEVTGLSKEELEIMK